MTSSTLYCSQKRQVRKEKEKNRYERKKAELEAQNQ